MPKKTRRSVLVQRTTYVNTARVSKVINKVVKAKKTKYGVVLYTNSNAEFSEADLIKIANALYLRYDGKVITT